MRPNDCTESAHQFHVASPHRSYYIKDKHDTAGKQTTEKTGQCTLPSEQHSSQHEAQNDTWIRQLIWYSVLLYVNDRGNNGESQGDDKKIGFPIHGALQKT